MVHRKSNNTAVNSSLQRHKQTPLDFRSTNRSTRLQVRDLGWGKAPAWLGAKGNMFRDHVEIMFRDMRDHELDHVACDFQRLTFLWCSSGFFWHFPCFCYSSYSSGRFRLRHRSDSHQANNLRQSCDCGWATWTMAKVWCCATKRRRHGPHESTWSTWVDGVVGTLRTLHWTSSV